MSAYTAREQAQEAISALHAATTPQEAYKKLGLSRDQFRHRVAKAKMLGLKPGKFSLPQESIAIQSEIDYLKAKLKASESETNRLRNAHYEAVKESDILARIKEEIYKISQAPPIIPTWTFPDKNTAKSSITPIVVASDWHYGEVISRAEVGGINEFNIAIANKRIHTFADRIVRICDSRDYKYPGIVLCLGGDFISGDDLHDELTDTNEAKTAQLLRLVQGQIVALIEVLAKRFGNVMCPCVVGNHGRNTAKPRFKKRVFTNYEYLLYHNLKDWFRNDKRISFVIPDESDCHFTVDGHRYMLTHGDALGTAGGDGIIGCLGPILRGKFKVSNSEKQIGRDFDTMVIGHFHQFTSLRGLIVNGSLKGYDEYARLKMRAPYEPPIQALWFSRGKDGPSESCPIRLE